MCSELKTVSAAELDLVKPGGTPLLPDTPLPLSLLGNPALLRSDKLGLFCSTRCPGDLILKAYDLAKKLRDEGVTVISGFHSPVEKECLRILLRGKQPIIICPARSLTNLRMPGDWKRPLESGRLLLLSPFSAKHRRVTADLAKRRNEVVAAIADKVCFIHVSPGGELEALREQVRQRGKTLVEADGGAGLGVVELKRPRA
jgi:predicted Rossmann fold nucleotide-binding protein DprA/Smf involved in DNA uptake